MESIVLAIQTAIEPEIIACNCWKAKKEFKYVLIVQLQSHGV